MNRLACLAAALSTSALLAGAFTGCGSDESGQTRVLDDAGSGGGGPRFTGDSATPGVSTSLGDTCQSDADCPGPGLFCVTNDNDEIFGGAPARGICVADCTEDPSVCRPLGAFCVANADDTPNDPRDDTAYCMQACATNSVAPDKCQGRADMLCVPTTQDPTIGFCQPSCGSDFDCPSDRVCSFASGLCVPPDAIVGTKPFGAQCTEDDECQGLCVGYQGTDFSFCSGYCALGTQGTCGADPTSTDSPDAFCFPLFGARGVGDLGACMEVCSCNEECEHPDAVCYRIEGLTGVPGLCDRPGDFEGGAGTPCDPSQVPDAGSDAGSGGSTGIDASAGGTGGTGGAGGSGGTSSGGQDSGTPTPSVDAAADSAALDGG